MNPPLKRCQRNRPTEDSDLTQTVQSAADRSLASRKGYAVSTAGGRSDTDSRRGSVPSPPTVATLTPGEAKCHRDLPGLIAVTAFEEPIRGLRLIPLVRDGLGGFGEVNPGRAQEQGVPARATHLQKWSRRALECEAWMHFPCCGRMNGAVGRTGEVREVRFRDCSSRSKRRHPEGTLAVQQGGTR